MERDDPDAIAGLPLEDAVEQVLTGDGVTSSATGSLTDRNDSHSSGKGRYGSDKGNSIPSAKTPSTANSSSSESDARDAETVRATLDRVTSDGVVSHDAAEEALSEASKVVSTAETRAELAALELSDAREAAEPVADLDAVAARLDGFEARLASVEDQVTELGSELEGLVGRTDEPGALYAVALGIRRLTAAANEVQRTADELQLDLESFERWLASPEARFEDLDADADAVERSIDELAAATDEIADGSATDAGAAWADARLRVRVTGLLVDDLRAELADLRAWNDGERAEEGRAEEERADGLADRLADLETRLATVEGRLDGFTRSAWEERFGDRLAAFETATADLEPPLAWGAVQAAYDEHRPEVEESE